MPEKTPVVLVTGANRGLGLEFSRQYAAEGWQVFAACRSPDKAGELKKLEADSGGRVRVLPMDVMDAASVKAAAGVIGKQPIDLLLNNAGVMGPRNDRIGSIDYAAWARVLDANTLGPMRVVEAFVGNVAKGGQKKIVTITSGMGSLAGQHERRLLRLPQLEGRGEHGGAKPRARPRAARHHLHRDESRLGAHGHGRAGRQTLAGREHQGDAISDC